MIRATIVDGTNAVDSTTVTLTLNASSVAATVNKVADTTTVSFTPSTILGPLSLNTVQVAYKGLDGTSYSSQWQFVVGPYTAIPPGDAPGSGSTPGFLARTVQAPTNAVIPNFYSFARAIKQLDGTLTDTGGVLVADVSIPGPNPDGSYNVDTINFHLGGTTYGFFPGDSPFPGIPGSEGLTDIFATEVLTYLALSAGTHHLGFSVTVDRTDFATDDGYTLFSGSNSRNFLSPVLGTFSRGNVPAFSSSWNSNVFTVVAPADGIYPMRLTYWQTHEDASLEWFSIDEATGDKILINDPADGRAIQAFRFSTAPSEGKPYVADITPAPGISGVSPLLPVTVLIIDDQTQLALNSIQLSLNGALIPSAAVTATKVNGRTTITYQPNATRTVVTNQWHLVFSDNASPTANSFTNDWQFNISVTSGVATPVAGQWDFNNCDLSATVGKPLQYFDGPSGQTAAGTVFGTCSSLGVSLINGEDARIMQVPGAIGNQYGYIMDHGIAPNGGGHLVNQYTLIWDIMVDDHAPDVSGAASLIQISSPTLNGDDGDLFWQGNQFGQGGGGYNGRGTFTPKVWHRVVAAYDEAANPPVVTKYVDGIKQDDWTANQGLDAPRRALQPTAILFGEGDGDERRVWWVNSVQIREGKMTDAQIAALGGPSASKIPVTLSATSVAGQWDFQFGDLSATVGQPLQYFDGPSGQTVAGTVYGTCSALGVPLINGVDAHIMQVPGDIGNQYGYIMTHGIPPNGGGLLVNQYTLIFDLIVSNCCQGAASLIQISSPTLNGDDGDLFWQGNQFGQGGGGYNGRGTFTPMVWHRVIAAYDEAASPPVVTKFVDGIKQDDWTANQGLDAPRRALQPTAILFGEGDGDERRAWWVSSIQISAGKMTDAEMAALGGPSGSKIPVAPPQTTVAGQWDFDFGDLSATVGQPLQYFDGPSGQTVAGTVYGTCSALGVPLINGVDAHIMQVPGDIGNQYGYIMTHGIPPNGGGHLVNQYTLIFDLMVSNCCQGAASLIQISSPTLNGDDGDLFWQGNQFGQGGGGYNGTGAFTPMAWHRVIAAYDEAASPPVVTKFVDGIKQDDWTANQGLDAPRRALQPTAILFGEGDGDERRAWWVDSVQIRAGKLSDAEMIALGGPSGQNIPVVVPTPPPAPPSPRLSLLKTGSTLQLTWPVELTGYTLESAASLSSPDWQPVAATGNCAKVPANTGNRFYRLVK